MNAPARSALQLFEMSEKLHISTPRLFCVLPSRTAMKLDAVAPRWLDPTRWTAGTFSLHPMCEWGGGHFLPSREAYPLSDPERNLRDMGSILHLGLEMLQQQLIAVEESEVAYSSEFIVCVSILSHLSTAATSATNLWHAVWQAASQASQGGAAPAVFTSAGPHGE